MPTPLPFELQKLICLHIPIGQLYGSLRLVSRAWRTAVLASMKDQFTRMARENEYKTLAAIVTQRRREGHLKGASGDFGSWFRRLVDVETCDMTVLIDVFLEVQRDVVAEVYRITSTWNKMKEPMETRWAALLGGLRIEDPGRLACVLGNVDN
ncbi:hypothetical protein M427DRAFT_139733 [Gonapodya prolifera JEL478]|uniref:F-box domain-containing protein n=1 Tax=Gonapodya prolifera (strain JEL478) TaxID=1344416 RepID=A0A139A0Q6_GONPJ|nr:hypothetical protein M427DRAFT_139733 [Gonapodya prolifera JEL478]|eukprot:KXS10304.1 hypothetical protein M427DRAFT_139733 [Gonapodya prolifera JEL478]